MNRWMLRAVGGRQANPPTCPSKPDASRHCMHEPASTHDSAQSAGGAREEFSALYDGCAQWLYSYLLSLLRRRDDAEEVLQQTAQLLWEKFEHYHRGTEFRAWACRVAHFKALEFRQKSRRR